MVAWFKYLCSTGIAAGALAMTLSPVVAQDEAGRAGDPLAEGFREPPHVARPHVWWHWMSGNVTKEGAQRDLEWMQRVGIGGVHAFAGGQLEKTYVPEPLPFMSDGWRAAYSAAVAQARAVGMDVVIAGSPGWSQTGGPWVPPEQAMKKYGWTTLEVAGGRRLKLKLPEAPKAVGPFQSVDLGGAHAQAAHAANAAHSANVAHGDAAIFAFPTPAAERPLKGTYSSPNGAVTALGDAPADLSQTFSLKIPQDGETSVDIDLGKASVVRALTVAISPMPALEVLASDDGREFRSVRKVAQTVAEKPAAQQTIALPSTRARYFRVRFARPVPWRVLPDLPPYLIAPPASTFNIRLLRLEGAPRVDRFEAKAGFQSLVDRDSETVNASGIDPAKVIDLSKKVQPDGTLDWTPPAGRWTIVRMGWSLTGHTNGPAEPSATGLEVDKLDPVAVRNYVDKLFAMYHDQGGNELGPQGIGGLLTDSWEAGVQNWTPTLLADFRRLRGYDPTPWLPVLTGQVVGDTKRSDAFLHDFRQTLKDLVISSHYEVLAKAAHEKGMTYYTEVQGDTPRAISDGMTAKARSDIPSGEFWYRPFAAVKGQPSLVTDLREAASAAHVYGKDLVAAEAMTVAAGNDPWSFSPGMLKPVADEIFAHGVNRMMIHESHMQPFIDRKPGLMLGIFGQFFNRNDTWAEQAKPWVDYLARTSWMLQQGKYVADVAYYYGEEENLTQRFELTPDTQVPAGHGFDYVNPEALLTKLSVRDGRVVTQSGMEYRLLFVPGFVTRWSVPTLQKLEELLSAGAMVVAPKPTGGLGMASGDKEIAAIVARLWGDGAGVRQVGKGKLYPAASLAQALAAERIVPDVAAPEGAQLLSLHRRAGDADIFFLSNRDDRAVTAPVAFRISGRAPEWWSAEDGKSRPLSYKLDGEVTRVSVPLEAKGAGFVLFRKPAAGSSLTVAEQRTVSEKALNGPWDVAFEAGRGAPPKVRFGTLTDWSKSEDAGVRYFSGAAVYSQKVRIDRASLGARRRTILDLGDVRELATVSVNGREVATAWHAPYRLDITGSLKPGSNLVEIKVANLWVNRLIGDKQPGAKPITYAPQSPYKADSPLRPSGLLGPVRLLVQEAE